MVTTVLTLPKMLLPTLRTTTSAAETTRVKPELTGEGVRMGARARAPYPWTPAGISWPTSPATVAAPQQAATMAATGQQL